MAVGKLSEELRPLQGSTTLVLDVGARDLEPLTTKRFEVLFGTARVLLFGRGTKVGRMCMGAGAVRSSQSQNARSDLVSKQRFIEPELQWCENGTPFRTAVPQR